MFVEKVEDIFKSIDIEAIVNPVNTVGVMGKGVALQCKQLYLDNFIEYKKKCDDKLLLIGSVHVYKLRKADLSDEMKLSKLKYIINFPTKKNWRNPSKLEFIDAGLNVLKKIIIYYKIKTIGIPKLGSGLGGLKWEEVRELIVSKLKDIPDVEIVFFIK
jgi:O-acetyl-ADP-ribose deacetylase (regulator of RNase III)